MLKTERQQSILAMCDRYGTITVKFIQEVLDVSDMTIRRNSIFYRSKRTFP